jgi:hypothetical protein
VTDRPNSALNSPALHEQYCSPNPPKQRGDLRTLANRQHPGMRLHENPIGLAPGKGSPQLSALLGGQFRRRASSYTIGGPLLSRRPGRIPPVPTRAAAEPGSAVDTVISRLRPCHLPEIATPGQAVSREAVDFGQFASVAYCPSVSGWDIAILQSNSPGEAVLLPEWAYSRSELRGISAASEAGRRQSRFRR